IGRLIDQSINPINEARLTLLQLFPLPFFLLPAPPFPNEKLTRTGGGGGKASLSGLVRCCGNHDGAKSGKGKKKRREKKKFVLIYLWQVNGLSSAHLLQRNSNSRMDSFLCGSNLGAGYCGLLYE